MVTVGKESVFNLKQIPLDNVRNEVYGLLIDGEECVMAFQTSRDQLLFTNKRVISIDVQGITGKKEILCKNALSGHLSLSQRSFSFTGLLF